ncbi:sigma-70 family RNA polymerase sigma factor [Brevibacillus sp. NRRL NRS-603]|uniref:sigma-70 family RNA polymerase sigma factor n=1 Tax=Brevibacillus TaxID=55080 RepID=UPI001E3CCBBB|nr:sigma-70 family RNA polymerase sigma factor [Brevibacillus sp. NRRL NRS-603]MED1945885.1 sigma-70 family RNA polymerase sigma factor [Brevibacillus formosus]MED2001161.1 sigma-70 family RNA polymerase sigma factor [Brevibacillus formosus]MED2085214.1 sigma-70 family RNA polymerase sigma factor [Brevibacillus formosus]
MNGLNEAETMPASLEVTREARLKWLMQQYGEKIFHLVSLTVKNHALADDITQNVFIQAYRHLDQFRGDGEIKHWLFKIAMNESKKHFRSWSFRNIFPTMDDHLGNLMDRQANNQVEEEILNRVKREEIVTYIQSLAPKYRQVILLHYYEDLSIAEVADILSVSQEVVRTRLHRARKQLKETMSKEVKG